MGVVKNTGFIFISIVLCALCTASQLFGGYFGQFIGFAPRAVQDPMRVMADSASALLSSAGLTTFILAFVETPGGS